MKMNAKQKRLKALNGRIFEGQATSAELAEAIHLKTSGVSVPLTNKQWAVVIAINARAKRREA